MAILAHSLFGKIGESASPILLHKKWSRDRDLNPGPHPYHGCALPTELSRQPLLIEAVLMVRLTRLELAQLKIATTTSR